MQSCRYHQDRGSRPRERLGYRNKGTPGRVISSPGRDERDLLTGSMHPLLDLSAHPVVGHRGAAGFAPENTVRSLELGLAQGAAALEFDVRLSADGVPVLMHDPTLDRTTNANGNLSQWTAGELATIDAGYRFSLDAGASFPFRGRGVSVPTLREVMARFPAAHFLLELKTVEVAVPTRQVLTEFDAGDRVILASFLDEALVPFREAGFVTGASRQGIGKLWARTLIGLGATPAPTDRVFTVPDRYKGFIPVPTRAFIRAARAAGRPVHVWTVDEPAEATRLWGLGVSGIITNFPGRILAERNRVARD